MGLVGLAAVVLVAVAGFLVMRPRPIKPLSGLLDAVDRFNADPNLTAAQKRHWIETTYADYAGKTVSVVGVVDDIYPNGSAVMQTSLAQVPWVGFDFKDPSPAKLRSFTKGRSMSMRAVMPSWQKYRDADSLMAVLLRPRVFCDGRWHGIKDVYKAQQGNAAGVQRHDAAPLIQ